MRDRFYGEPEDTHKVVVAREVLEDVAPADDVFPSYLRHREVRQAEALYRPDPGTAR